jgi:hypothetical protein
MVERHYLLEEALGDYRVADHLVIVKHTILWISGQ